MPEVNFKRIVLFFSAFLFISTLSFAQHANLSGTPNSYLRVDEVQTDRVVVSDLLGTEFADFQPGDVVLLIQMTGTTPYTVGDYFTNPTRSRESFNQTGMFEIFQIDEVYESAGLKYVEFTDEVAKTYDAGERIQLVKFTLGETVTTTGPVTAMSWDSTYGIGGIVAIIGTDKVELNHTVSADGKGFLGGAMPSEYYTGGCRYDPNPSSVLDTLYFLPTELNRSGNKGEGVMTVDWPYNKGKAFDINGGGAGNGLYSGGGGGSNYSAGGNGGRQSSVCISGTLNGAWGGYGCQGIYNYSEPRIIMGGGGGSGTKRPGTVLSPGGNGGGIIIIIADTLESNSVSVTANGISASSTTGTGGGGGAGGTVLIDATIYNGDLSIVLTGGNGGSNPVPDDTCTGTGGGGSGGVFWHTSSSLPAGITVDTSYGAYGSTTTGCPINLGERGYEGIVLENLILPLTGFLFNTVKGVDTICAGQQPGPLIASQPKGGDGTYAYNWEQSTDEVSWITASGTGDLRNFQPDAMSQTLYFRRIVSSAGIYDTSKVVEVFAYPVITNNFISETDTLCSGEQANPLSGLQPAGGDGTYSYQWQISMDLADWSNDGNTESANNPHDPGILTETSYYRRLVNSTAYCSDTSDYLEIVVYEVPVANAGGDDEVCSIEYVLSATRSITGSNGLWTATGVGFDDPESPDALAAAADYGSYILTWTETNWECSDADQIEVIFYEQPGAAEAGPDQELQFIYTTTLEASAPAVGTGLWEVITGNGVFDDPQTAITAVNELDDYNQLLWTVTNGVCEPMSDSLEIIVNPLVIQKGFTPNGDTKNDFFILDLTGADQIKIQIFNSAGVLVYESDDYRNDEDPWDGRNMNGVELPEGTYFYIITIKVEGKANEVQFKSFIELLR